MPPGAGTAKITVRGVQLLSQDRVLDGLSLRIGWMLMWFGGWEEWGPEYEETEDGKLIHIDYPVGPPTDGTSPPPGLDIVASLSTIISRCYLRSAAGTVHPTSDSEILQPGFMGSEFIPDDWMTRNLQLPIAKLEMQPNFDPSVVARAGS